MNNIIISWEHNQYIIGTAEKIITDVLKPSHIVNIIGNNDKDYKNTETTSYVYKEDFYNKVNFGFSDISIINLLKDYEVNIFKVISRNFRAGRKDDSLNNITLYYHKILYNIDKLVKENKLEIALFFDTPHHPFDYILFLYFKVTFLKHYVCGYLPFPHNNNAIIHRYNTSNFPNLDENFTNNYKNILYSTDRSHQNTSFVQQYIDEYKGINHVSYNKSHLGSKWTWNYLMPHLLSRTLVYIKKNQLLEGLKKTNTYLSRITINQMRAKKVLSYYKSRCTEVKYDRDYIYFPLQFQPEASTIPLGNEFSNLELVVNYLLLNTNNLCIYIREHPAYWHRLSSTDNFSDARSIEFYKRILNDKRVFFVETEIDHLDLIRHSKFVATVTGTVAFEAFGMNKMVLFFGDYIYATMANTIVSPSSEAISFMKSKFSDSVNLENEFISTLMALEKISNRSAFLLETSRGYLMGELESILKYMLLHTT